MFGGLWYHHWRDRFGNVFHSVSRVWLFASHGLQHARLPCPSPSPRICSNSCPLSRWCCRTISSSATPFSSCPQSFPASGSFLVSPLFASDGQSVRASASASVLPILQARLLEWVANPFSRGSSWPSDWTRVFCIAGRFFTIWATRKAQSLIM